MTTRCKLIESFTVDNTLLHFETTDALTTYVKSHHPLIELKKNISQLDFDTVADWTVDSNIFPAEEILNAWNIFFDFWQLESAEWQMFRTLSDEAMEVHFNLSAEWISSRFDKTGPVNPDNIDLELLHRVIQRGMRAFDLSLTRERFQ